MSRILSATTFQTGQMLEAVGAVVYRMLWTLLIALAPLFGPRHPAPSARRR